MLGMGSNEELRSKDLLFSGRLHVPRVLRRIGGPQLGEHTDDVLAGLGLSDEQVRGLRERGII